MTAIAISRLSMADHGAVERYFATGPAQPCVFTDATAEWPARGKWTLDFFAREFGDEFEVAKHGFVNARSGRAMKLRDFILGFDRPLDETPGFWVDGIGLPIDYVPEADADQVWSFGWRPFRRFPHLLADISPFPAQMGNMVATVPSEVYAALQALSGYDFHSIYISRPGTITPLHEDYGHSIGCLVQFSGTKQVTMFAPADYAEVPGQQFDPEQPDYVQFPQMQGKVAHVTTLHPGDMLIIAPDWWHHTRANEGSITLSHNFFTQHNFAAYMGSQLAALAQFPDRDKRLAKIARHLSAETPGQAG